MKKFFKNQTKYSRERGFKYRQAY